MWKDIIFRLRFFYFDKLFSKTIISYEKVFFEKANTFLGMLLPKHYDKIGKKLKKSIFSYKKPLSSVGVFLFRSIFLKGDYFI